MFGGKFENLFLERRFNSSAQRASFRTSLSLMLSLYNTINLYIKWLLQLLSTFINGIIFVVVTLLHTCTAAILYIVLFLHTYTYYTIHGIQKWDAGLLLPRNNTFATGGQRGGVYVSLLIISVQVLSST